MPGTCATLVFDYVNSPSSRSCGMLAMSVEQVVYVRIWWSASCSVLFGQKHAHCFETILVEGAKRRFGVAFFFQLSRSALSYHGSALA